MKIGIDRDTLAQAMLDVALKCPKEYQPVERALGKLYHYLDSIAETVGADRSCARESNEYITRSYLGYEKKFGFAPLASADVFLPKPLEIAKYLGWSELSGGIEVFRFRKDMDLGDQRKGMVISYTEHFAQANMIPKELHSESDGPYNSDILESQRFYHLAIIPSLYGFQGLYFGEVEGFGTFNLKTGKRDYFTEGQWLEQDLTRGGDASDNCQMVVAFDRTVRSAHKLGVINKLVFARQGSNDGSPEARLRSKLETLVWNRLHPDQPAKPMEQMGVEDH
jgi:hypothetical protein